MTDVLRLRGVSNPSRMDQLLWVLQNRSKDPAHFFRDELITQHFGRPAEQCWIMDNESIYHRLAANEKLSNVIWFTSHESDVHPSYAFQVKLGFSGAKAICEAKPTTMNMLQQRTNRRQWFDYAEKAVLSTDRTVIGIAPTRPTSVDMPDPSLRFDVGIRRVATSSLGFTRYVLSIADALWQIVHGKKSSYLHTQPKYLYN